METQSLAYTAKELLATLQGPALLQIIESPDDLCSLIDSLEGISGIATYLAESEQRMYPDTAPKRKGLRRNRVRVVVKQKPHVLPEETREFRILAFVGKWMKKYKQAPTLRDMRNYHKGWEDVDLIVADLLSEGKLCKINGERTDYYALPEQTKEVTSGS